jgi:hypothetical protein
MRPARLSRGEMALGLVVGVLLLTGCEGCIIYGRCVHDPPLAENVPKIVRGQTTRAQILDYFGIPDLEAQGSTVILHDDSMMGKHRLKTKRRLERAAKSAERFKTNSEAPRASPTSWYDRLMGFRAYSSIDNDHVAYLYEELEERYIAGMTFGLPVAIGGADYRIRRNKLLVLINKHTEVVDEFGYRQEFNAR